MRSTIARPRATVYRTPLESVYTPLLRVLPEVDGWVVAQVLDDLEQGGYHPLGGESTDRFLKRLIGRLSKRGLYLDPEATPETSDQPTIARRPVLFVRARTMGFASALQAILADIGQRDDLPPALLRVVGIEASETKGLWDTAEKRGGYAISEEVLLTKPANREQVQIAQRLERYGGVLVQGPPGTGKTHTIANLLGHLLAQGKSVLVTAHTTKALRVLHEQVVAPLQPLCVSVLDSDIDGRRQLERAVIGITERLARDSAEALDADGQALAERRRALVRALRDQEGKLLAARQAEYQEIVVAGQAYTASAAARLVAAGAGAHDWIPGPVRVGAPLPLSGTELGDLYRLNAIVSPKDERDHGGMLPDPAALLDPNSFRQIVEEKAWLAEQDLQAGADLWQQPSREQAPEALEAALSGLLRAAAPLQTEAAWQLAAFDAGARGGPHREPWDELLALVADVVKQAASARSQFVRLGPVLSNTMPLVEQRTTIDSIIAQLKAGRRLGTLTLLKHKDWKRFIATASVGGRPPARLEDFEALGALANIEVARQDLRGRWERLLAPLGAPLDVSQGLAPEQACEPYLGAVRAALNWHGREWQPSRAALEALGLRWLALYERTPLTTGPYATLGRIRTTVQHALPVVVQAQANRLRDAAIEQELGELTRRVDALASGEVALALRLAVRHRNPDAYADAYRRLVDLLARRGDLERRRTLLQRLETSAPGWAAAITARQAPHDQPGVPGDAEAAWLWRQLHDGLDALTSTPIDDLQAAIAQARTDLDQVTADLVDRRAWAAQIRRTTLNQRQALMGWLAAIRKIGKGTGKRVPVLRAEARRLMAQSRSAVPVWVMPLTRVVEHFDPRTTSFDVVIIDEASQSDVMALIAPYLGKQIVIVGDHEQVSPEGVGQNLEAVQRLIDTHLSGIPNAQLYDVRTSIYDLAMQSFGGLVRLVEHFRCVPDIIQFSNHLAYNGDIRPLRDPSAVALRPHVVAHRVQGTKGDRNVNEAEAMEIATLVAAATEQPEYKGKTIGVISLLGEEQAGTIERLLRERLEQLEFERRRIVCGTAAQFQGDERDVMFLSVVDSPQTGPLAMRDTDSDRRRYNVAASRARDQMWVVHSLDLERDLKPGDLRRRLLEHAHDPQQLVQLLERNEARTESEFERRVLRRLAMEGYRVVPQWQVGYYRIDLVVEGGDKRLAIECDGDRFHPPEKLREDMERQAVLERLGWTFVRIRGSQFFRDEERAMRPVFARLAEMDIKPEGQHDQGDRPETEGMSAHELRDRVIRRAAALAVEWQTQQPLTGRPVTTFDSKGNEPVLKAGRAALPTPSTNPPKAQPVSPPLPGMADTSVVAHLPSRPRPAPAAPSPHAMQGTSAGSQPARQASAPVTDALLLDALNACLPKEGRIAHERLMGEVAHWLGFNRLRQQDRRRLNALIAAEGKAGRVGTDPRWDWHWRVVASEERPPAHDAG